MKLLSKYKYNIYNLITSLFTYLAFLIYFKKILTTASYNFILTLIYFVLFYLYNQENKKIAIVSKRDKIIINLFSIFLSTILIIGSLVNNYVTDRTAIIFTFRNIIYSLVGIIGFYYLFRIIVMKIFDEIKISTLDNFNKFSKKNFIKVMFLIFLCYLPYFFRFFPGAMSPDSYYIIHNVNQKILSDHHTFGHTWFFGFFYLIGKALFTKSNYAIAFYIIVQMIINSFIFTLIIKFLHERTAPKMIVFIVTFFLCLSPLYAIYSVTLWRDILFGLAFVPMFISLYNFIENDYKLSKNIVVMYLLSVLIILFFRNNGIYVLIFFTVFFVLFTKKSKKTIAISHLVIIAVYFIIKGPVFNYFGISNSISSEAYSVPLQQISRVLTTDNNLDKDDYEYLKTIIDIEQMKENYNPIISDGVKKIVDSQKLSETKTEFFKLWFKLLIKYPRVYIEAYLCHTLGYWYPDVVYWATTGEGNSFLDDDVYAEPLLKEYLEILDLTTKRELPLSNLLWSLGLMFITFTFSITVLIYKKEYQYILCYMPLFCLWLSLMLAAPVYAELRYIYGLFACISLVLVCPFLPKKKVKQ